MICYKGSIHTNPTQSCCFTSKNSLVSLHQHASLDFHLYFFPLNWCLQQGRVYGFILKKANFVMPLIGILSGSFCHHHWYVNMFYTLKKNVSIIVYGFIVVLHLASFFYRYYLCSLCISCNFHAVVAGISIWKKILEIKIRKKRKRIKIKEEKYFVESITICKSPVKM